MTQQYSRPPRAGNGGRPRAADGAVYDKVREFVDRAWTPKQIWEELTRLSQQEEKGELKGRYVPPLRTIENYVKELTRLDKSGSWSLADLEPGIDAETFGRDILDVLAAVAEGTEGRVQQLTRSQVRWLERFGNVTVNVAPWSKYRLANLYLLREGRNESTADLDLFVAFQQWNTPQELERYQKALEKRWVPAPPEFLLRLLDRNSDVRTAEGIQRFEQELAQQAVSDQDIGG